MYMPIDFIDFGLRAFMRNPFFTSERISVQRGESGFRLLDATEGLVATLGPDTSFLIGPADPCADGLERGRFRANVIEKIDLTKLSRA